MLSGLENPTHLLLIFVVILLLFGAKRLPEIGRGIGSGMRGFKDALTEPQQLQAAPDGLAQTTNPEPASVNSTTP